jgi:hypothetical protein
VKTIYKISSAGLDRLRVQNAVPFEGQQLHCIAQKREYSRLSSCGNKKSPQQVDHHKVNEAIFQQVDHHVELTMLVLLYP